MVEYLYSGIGEGSVERAMMHGSVEDEYGKQIGNKHLKSEVMEDHVLGEPDWKSAFRQA